MIRGKCADRNAGVQGFTLLELSIVLVLIGIILGMGLVTLTAGLQAAQYNATVARMDEIEKALLDYAIANNRIPCPSDLTLTTSSANYGFEAGAGSGSAIGTGTGVCTGMTPQANFVATSATVEGGLPTRALQLPDEYMYDGWGRKFRYAVDPTQTKTSALPAAVYSPCGIFPSAITVNDASGAARSTAAAYALISHGANGHGAYTSNGVVLNAGSVNVSELVNCHCNSSAAPTTYSSTYVEMAPTADPNNALDNFDDIVTFKEPWQFQALNYPLSQTVAQCIYVADSGNNRVEIFNTGGNYIGQFGSYGSGNGNLYNPNDIAIDASGNVWVVDTYNSRVEEFSSSGTYLGKLGSPGTGNGQLNFPRAIAIDSAKHFWIADTGNSRVQEFDSSGNYLMQFGSAGTGNGQFNSEGGPYGIAVDSSGNIWTADLYNYRVEEFNISGNFVRQVGSHGSGNGQFASPDGITVDQSNNVWVADGNNARVEEFANNGTFLNTFGTSGHGNGQITGDDKVEFDSSGNIWVADTGNNRVEEFSSSWNYLLLFGSSYGSPGSGNGQFNRPQSIAIGSR